MTKAFYFLLTFFSLQIGLKYQHKLYSSKLIEPVWTLSWIPKDSFTSFSIFFFVVTPILCFLNIFKDKQWLRILTFIFFTLSISVDNSFGRISHYYHTIFWFALILTLVNDKEKRIKLLTAAAIIPHLLNALWRIKSLFQNEFNVQDIYANLISSSAAAFYSNLNIVQEFLITNSSTSTFIYLVVITIELLSLIAVFNRNARIYIIPTLALITLSNIIILNVTYLPHFMALLFITIMERRTND